MYAARGRQEGATRHHWSAVVVILLVLGLASAMPVAGGGRKSFSLSDSGIIRTDCIFSPVFTWTNYGNKTYTAHLWILYDGAPIPHPSIPGRTIMDWTDTAQAGTDDSSHGGLLTGTTGTLHTITYRATLSTETARPRVLIDATWEHPDVDCSLVAS